MPEIYFIRHGQASFGSENYDNLSNLGKRQSKIVGSYFKKIDLTFDRIISGTLNRQLQTCNHIIKEISFSNDPEKTILLNEYNVRSVLLGYVGNRDLTKEEKFDEKIHFILLKKAITAWSKNKIKLAKADTWVNFQKRGLDVLNNVSKFNNKRTLVISSAGTISMIIAQILELPERQFVNFHLQLYNTGFSKVIFDKNGAYLSLFNSVAHLENIGDPKIITHV